MVELIAQCKRATRELEESLGRTPGVEELAEHMSMTTDKVRMIRHAIRAFQRPSQSPVNEDGESFGLADMLRDDRSPSPEQSVLDADEFGLINELLESIDDREATILRLRFGLDGEEPLTLNEIGRRVGLTRERVRQIEAEALRKLNGRLTRIYERSDKPDNGAATDAAAATATLEAPPASNNGRNGRSRQCRKSK